MDGKTHVAQLIKRVAQSSVACLVCQVCRPDD